MDTTESEAASRLRDSIMPPRFTPSDAPRPDEAAIRRAVELYKSLRPQAEKDAELNERLEKMMREEAMRMTAELRLALVARTRDAEALRSRVKELEDQVAEDDPAPGFIIICGHCGSRNIRMYHEDCGSTEHTDFGSESGLHCRSCGHKHTQY